MAGGPVGKWLGVWVVQATADDAGHDREIEMTLGPLFLFLWAQTPDSKLRCSGLRTPYSGCGSSAMTTPKFKLGCVCVTNPLWTTTPALVLVGT